MNRPRPTERQPGAPTLPGRQYRPTKVDFLTKPWVQRLEDRVRGGRSGRAEGAGESFATAAGEQPAHTIIDAQRDRALAELAESFESALANSLRAREQATVEQQMAERECGRLTQLRAAKRAALDGLEARHAA